MASIHVDLEKLEWRPGSTKYGRVAVHEGKEIIQSAILSDRRQEGASFDRAVALNKVGQIRQAGDCDDREPDVIRGHRRRPDQPSIGYQRENDADEDEELAGGQDLILRDQAGKAVHPLTRPDDQHGCNGRPIATQGGCVKAIGPRT